VIREDTRYIAGKARAIDEFAVRLLELLAYPDAPPVVELLK
jgi:hypothetical protein